MGQRCYPHIAGHHKNTPFSFLGPCKKGDACLYDHSMKMPSAVEFVSSNIPNSLMPLVKKQGINISQARKEYLDKHAPGGGRPSGGAERSPSRGRKANKDQENEERDRARSSSRKRAVAVGNLLENNDPDKGVCQAYLVGRCEFQDKGPGEKCKHGRHVDPKKHAEDKAEWRAKIGTHLSAIQ